jgi:hypothetical protein
MARIRATIGMLGSVLFCFCVSVSAAAEMPSAATALLNHLTGNWVLRGTIAGKPTTHDVQAVWVINHEYLQLHEISREKNASGGPAYEAIVYIGWDTKAKQYTCLWLDSTSGDGLSSGVIGRASPAGDSIPFVFTLSASDQIRTRFSYDKTAGTWQWLIDSVTDGRTQPFANVTLNRVP